MRYIQQNLLQNEKLIYATRPHWIIFGPSVVILLITILFYGFAPSIIGNIAYFQLFGYYFYQLVTFLLFIAAIYTGLGAYITFVTTEYCITDRRVLMKTGWIQRRSLEVFLNKVEGVKVNQSVLGRILGYGTLLVIGTGGTTDAFYSAPDPLAFRKKVQQQIYQFDKEMHES